MPTVKTHVVGLFVLGLMLCPPSALGQHVGTSITEQDVALLPEYCRYTQLFNEKFGSPEGQRAWFSKLGPDFKHLHHYCWALVAIQRSKKFSERHQRWGLLNNAVGDCNYVIHNSSPNFPLIPAVLTARAVAYGGMGKNKEAMDDFKRAQQLLPTRAATYVEWATFLVSKGEKAQARQVVEEGLKRVPESESLRRLAAEMK